MTRPIAAVSLFVALLGSFDLLRHSHPRADASCTPVGQDIQTLNDEIFGRPSSEPVILLRGSSSSPVYVQTDIKEGKYVAANVSYPRPMTLEVVEKSLATLYAPSAAPMSSGKPRWILKEKQIVIVAHEDEEGVRVYYLPVMSSEQVLEQIMKAVSQTSK